MVVATNKTSQSSIPKLDVSGPAVNTTKPPEHKIPTNTTTSPAQPSGGSTSVSSKQPTPAEKLRYIKQYLIEKTNAYKEQGHFPYIDNPTLEDLYNLESQFAGDDNRYFLSPLSRSFVGWLKWWNNSKVVLDNEGNIKEITPPIGHGYKQPPAVSPEILESTKRDKSLSEFQKVSKTIVNDPDDYNWYDHRASTWYEGYGEHGVTPTGTGNFVDLSKLEEGTAAYDIAYKAIENNILGLFQQKGLSENIIKKSHRYKSLISQAKEGDTIGAFRAAASYVPNAIERGAKWGAEGMPGIGKSYLQSIADGTVIPTSTYEENTVPYFTDIIQQLYTTGFGTPIEDIDSDGLDYWLNEVQMTGDWKSIAQSFLDSDEAKVRDQYFEHYNRDADDPGLYYWLQSDYPAEEFDRSVSYRGEDLDGDGFISLDEVFSSRWDVQTETIIRDMQRDLLGQISKQEDRAKMPDYVYTAPNNDEIIAQVNQINSMDQSDQQDALEDIEGKLQTTGLIMDTGSQSQSDNNPADPNATGMGIILTSDQIGAAENTHHSDDSVPPLDAAGNQFASADEWGATEEGTGDPDSTYIPYTGYETGDMTPEEAENLILPQNIGEWKEHSSLWSPTIPGTDGSTSTIGEEGWTPEIPDKPSRPEPLELKRTEIDYTTEYKSDVKDTSGYKKTKSKFNKAYNSLNPTVNADGSELTATPQTVGQRFVDKSAKGVRFKRSLAALSGRAALGTKQLARGNKRPTPLSTLYANL